MLALAILCVVLCCCGDGYHQNVSPTATPSQQSDSGQTENEPYIPDQFGQSFGDFIKTYTNEDRLSYREYEITKLTRTAKNESQRGSTSIEYAVLRRNQHVVATFDTHLDRLAQVRFGLFSFLGNSEKQLMIEQTSEKFWRYWIVDFDPEFRVIYDSNDYDLVYELRVSDVNGDGYSEVLQNLGTFWYFDSLDNLYSPRPPVIFAYQPNQRKYTPSNFAFASTLLKDIDQRVAKTREVIERKDEPNHAVHVKSAVLDVFLRYAYSGNVSEGWKFYDQHYDIDDKGELKDLLLKKLRQDRLYTNQQARISRK